MTKKQLRCDIEEQSIGFLSRYGEIPIRYQVHGLFEVTVDDPASATLVERQVQHLWVKDYGTAKGEAPTDWPNRWDISNWDLLAVTVNGYWVGGYAVAFNTEGVEMLDRRDDLAVLWDIRVHPDHRGNGIGSKLFNAVIEWVSDRQCHELKVETQNINVPACRFYKRQGAPSTPLTDQHTPIFPMRYN